MKKNIGVFTRKKVYHYRVPLFKRLINNKKYNIKIFTGDKKFKNLSANILEEKKFKIFNKEIRYQLNLKEKIQNNNLDIAIMPFSPYNLSTMKIVLNNNRNYKIVAWTHGYFKGNEFDSWKMKIFQFFLKKTDGILFFTEDIADYYKKNVFPEKKIFYADNTLNIRKIEEAKRSVTDKQLNRIKKKYNLVNRNTLIFVGRIIKNKRLKILLKALKFIKNNSNIKTPFLFIIGDGPEKVRLKKFSQKFLSDDVVWLGKIINEEYLAPYFLSSDIFVMPGKTGLCINHAFAYELPYITTDDNIHAPEFYLFENEENGELFESENYKDLASKIENLLLNPKTINRYSKNGYKIIKERYNLKNMEKNILNMIDELVE
ncbi:MAG: glycosyltransferase family 4 protein, partial [archaeon]